MMNILILSAGTRNKVVQYFKREMAGKVIATDCSNLGPAIYDADKCYLVPRIDDPAYIDKVIDICKKEDIQEKMVSGDPKDEVNKQAVSQACQAIFVYPF